MVIVLKQTLKRTFTLLPLIRKFRFVHVSVDTEREENANAYGGCLQSAHARASVAQRNRSRQRERAFGVLPKMKRSGKVLTHRCRQCGSAPSVLSCSPSLVGSLLGYCAFCQFTCSNICCFYRRYSLPILTDFFTLIIFTSPFPPHCT